MTEHEIILDFFKKNLEIMDKTSNYTKIIQETCQSLQTGKAKILYFANDKKYFHTIAARDQWNKQISETQRVSEQFFQNHMSLQDALGAFALCHLYPNFKEIYSKTKIYLSTEYAPHFIREICPDDTVNLQRVDTDYTTNITFEDLSKARISND
jgi:hypothetical protein